MSSEHHLPNTSRTEYPDEFDPYSVERIEQDKTWYSHFLDENMFFFDGPEEHVYTMSDIDQGTFDLRACATIGTPPTQSQPAGEANPFTNICSLAGAYELGEVVPLAPGELRILNDVAFLNVGDFVLSFPSQVAATQLREWLDTTDAATINVGTLKSRIEAQTIDITDTDTDITVYHPPTESAPGHTDQSLPSASTPTTRNYSSEDLDIETRFVPVKPFSKWTFESSKMKTWAEEHLSGRVLNACAGKTRLNHTDEIIRNDSNPDRTADLHVDAAELAAHFDKEAFETILFDPPWSLYQSNLRYNSHGEHIASNSSANIDMSALPFDIPNGREKTQLGHARLAKAGFDYLLKPGGTVLQLTFHGTTMPGGSYQRRERTLFDPIGEGKCVIGSVDKKVQNDLTAYQ